MKVYLATDHAGFDLKEKIKLFLQKEGYEVEDCGAYQFDKNDDYPDFISKAVEAVSKDPENSKAIIFGSSGQGEAMVANKFKNVRAAVFYTPVIPAHNVDVSGRVSNDPFEMIRLTREHNDANILSIGAKIISEVDALKAIKLWLQAPFTNEERHKRRIDKIKKLETDILK
ncbi:MAG: RpiB/LacA/LacB family sugar-phosphate isomerase [Candidatus Levyibacteriota bacterium]